LAEEPQTGRQVALKFLSQSLDQRARSFFKQEAALLSRLSHPNLVRIFDYSEDPEPCFAMEYVDGPSLAEAVQEAGEDRLQDLFVQTCRGLSYIHALNLLHRDVKPSNILVAKEGTVKILDSASPAWVPRPTCLPKPWAEPTTAAARSIRWASPGMKF
jgi:serine/threonine-protein kinase